MSGSPTTSGGPKVDRSIADAFFPATFEELTQWFHDESICREHLEVLRWPNGFVCPRCDGRDAWHTAGGLWLCRSCRLKVSVTAGTIFHRSKIPLPSWFAAAWLMTAGENGISALALQRELGLGSYETAWAMLQRFRRAMVIPAREKLSGLVEVDETYVGARESDVSGQLVSGNAVIVIVVELKEPRGLGRVRLAIVHEASRVAIYDFISRAVQPGSTIRTDGRNLYNELPGLGYIHEQAHVVLPGVRRVASLLKRWIGDTFHSGISHDHLESYLDEFVFRFNRRSVTRRGPVFQRLLEQAVRTDPAPFEELVGGNAVSI